MPRLFGTDGVRGVANRDLTPDLALALGRAAGRVLAPSGGRVLVGRDTRVSGPMLEGALVAGLCASGVEVSTLGIVPTPAVAYLAVHEAAHAGGVISASHNPVADNGIKFFSSVGRKISADQEHAIERLLEQEVGEAPEGTSVGFSSPHPEGVGAYAAHLVDSAGMSFEGLKVVLDCAFGAAWELAPSVFRELGATVVAMNDEPDGARINVDCGSTSLDGLARAVTEQGADVGFGFDGDADRVMAIDERGGVVDGDRIIALTAIQMHDEGTLTNDVVVATVMANLGFRRVLEERGIEVVQAPVGDKYVVDAMQERGAVLGGEQSGHIVFASHSTTGDGILAAVQVARSLSTSQQPLSRLAHVFEPVPQVLINVEVADKSRLDDSARLWEEVRAVEAEMGEEGRVLLRPSGTEPVVRVMVEAIAGEVAEANAARLADAVKEHLS